MQYDWKFLSLRVEYFIYVQLGIKIKFKLNCNYFSVIIFFHNKQNDISDFFDLKHSHTGDVVVRITWEFYVKISFFIIYS